MPIYASTITHFLTFHSAKWLKIHPKLLISANESSLHSSCQLSYGGANKLLISFGMKCDTDRASNFDSLCWAAMKSAIIGILASQSPGSSSVAVISHGKSGKLGR